MEDHVRHYLISGRVQGVGYRAFAVAHARELQIRGWARNLTDGRVEVVASASDPKLSNFETFLRQGPARGQVTELAHEDWPTLRDLGPTFDVRKDATAPCSATLPY